jgi:addiction module HigA family antidote
MNSDGFIEYVPAVVTPPGDTLKEALDEIGMTQAELARRMGRPKKTINEIIRGKAAITHETALQLERVLDIPAHFWRALEDNYQQHILKSRDLRLLEEHADWLDEIPMASMVREGWAEPGDTAAENVANALRFFGVASVDAFRDTWGAAVAAFRQSPSFQSNRWAIAAWLRKGEIEAARLRCAPYSRKRFEAALAQARKLTIEEPAIALKQLQEVCSKAGVAVVFVPELPGCAVSGAARWYGLRRAIIQLSFRHKRDDHVWFSFFHEAGHLLSSSPDDVFVDTPGEDAADEFARDYLIPPASYAQFLNSVGGRKISREAARNFASEIGIAPGIVVGRLQHDGVIPYSHLNGLTIPISAEILGAL